MIGRENIKSAKDVEDDKIDKRKRTNTISFILSVSLLLALMNDTSTYRLVISMKQQNHVIKKNQKKTTTATRNDKRER